MEVQVRLAGQEVVQIILHPPAVPLPGRAAEDRQPVVGRRAVGLGVGPDIPIGLGVVAARAAFDEPRMRLGGMRQHEVDHHPDVQGMRRLDDGVEIRQRAEHRIDIAVIGNVVAEILHRRGEERRNPDRVYPERGYVRQTLHDAAQIADPVSIGVLIAARINLIDHRAAPPVGVGRHARDVGRGRDRDGRVHRKAVLISRSPRAGRARGISAWRKTQPAEPRSIRMPPWRGFPNCRRACPEAR